LTDQLLPANCRA